MIFPRTTTVREIQRNYKKVFEQVKRTKEPVIVMKNNKPDVAIVDIKKLEATEAVNPARAVNWDKLWKDLKRVRAFKGKGNGNLSAFIAHDRQTRR